MLPLKERKQVAEDTMAFYFDLKGNEFTFKAGQFAKFTLIDPPKTDEEGNSRSFSIASSPTDTGYLMVTTRMRDTAFKNSLKEVPIGTEVQVMGPMGPLTLHSDTERPAVFLAGGIGITPFRSMIEWSTKTKSGHKIYLFYANRTEALIAFKEEFEQWAEENPNLKLIFAIDSTEASSDWKYSVGRINAELLKKHISPEDLESAIYYSAGPPGMVNAMRSLLEEMKIDELHIKTEDFEGY